MDTKATHQTPTVDVTAPRASGWMLVLGTVLVVLGAFATTLSVAATLVSVLFVGWLLLFAGAMEATYAFRKAKRGGLVLHVVNGVLSVFAGFLVLMYPADVRRLVLADAGHGVAPPLARHGTVAPKRP